MPSESAKQGRKSFTALLAWEIGAGFSHSQNLWGVVRHLRHMGMRCVVATADPRFETWFRALGAEVVQTYLWPVMRTNVPLPDQRPNRVLTDVLANYGVSRQIDLTGAIAHYDTLFRLVEPDIVLCENAFGAVLAARGRYPVVIFGSTLLFMPPIIGDAFAPIDRSEPAPSWPVEGVLDEINAGLGASARIPLATAAQVLDCDARVPFGPAAFDPYRELRIERVYSPHCPDLPKEPASEPGTETIVYLHDVAQMSGTLMAALAGLDPGARIYIPTLRPALREKFLEAGHKVEDRMMPLRLLAERAGVLLHHGGVTLSAAALALGVPQVILARFYENGLVGRFITEEGLGYARRMDKADADWIRQTVASERADRKLRDRARQRMAEFRRWFAEDPTGIVASEAADILGSPTSLAPPLADNHAWSPI